MQALLKRHSTRAFRQEELGVQVLSDLLWTAFGVNRPETGGRTAPSAYNVRDIDIYLATAKGLYRYEAGNHSLTALLPDDLRASTGTQSYVAGAPVNLVYVSDHGRMASFTAQDREQWSWAHSGLIAQNVYLFCASEGLVTVVRSTIDRERLAGRMGLNDSQHITLAQSLGYPATG
jgi:nitroreductase